MLENQAVSFRMSILDGTLATVYSETHNVTTTAQGIASLTIGGGTVESGTFSTIDWGASTYSLEVELDPTGGTTYVNMGTSQFVSVPYALRAKFAENVSSSLWDGDTQKEGSDRVKQLEAENEALRKELKSLNAKVDQILKQLKQ